MKMGLERRKNGFSLIELIIAIAILVILTGLLAPQFLKHIEKSRKAVCDSNIDEMMKLYDVSYIESNINSDDKAGRLQLAEDVIKDSKAECPSGGTYSAELNLLDQPEISCSVHGKQEKGIEKDVYDNMEALRKMSVKELRELIGAWPSNSNVRNYIRNHIYGGAWPTLPSDLLKKNGLEEKDYYVQPYLNLGAGTVETTNETDITIFANTSGGDNWNTYLVYDMDERQWYIAPLDQWKKRKNILVNGKSWADVKSIISDPQKGWTPLK